MSQIQSSILQSGTWGFPIPIHYGPGCIAQLPGIAGDLAMTRPLLVSDTGTAGLPFVGEILRQLEAAGLVPRLFSEFSPNPTDIECISGAGVYRESGCDGVIAIGGGSSLDAGKAIAISAPGAHADFWEFDGLAEPLKFEGERPFAPLLCIPTTSGTGAEVEPAGMVTNTGTREKRGFLHPDFRVSAAILDPELTTSLPANLTAWTGLDAIVHAIEAYLTPEFHPMCDGIALQALGLMAPAIRRAWRDGSDLEARSAMMIGSCLAAVAFTKGLGIVHSVSHMVGGLYDTQHGLTNAVILPAALRFNRTAIEHKAAELARTCGARTHDFDGLYAWVVELNSEFEIPHGLSELGVLAKDVDRLTEMAMHDLCLSTNPRAVARDELRGFICEAVEKTW